MPVKLLAPAGVSAHISHYCLLCSGILSPLSLFLPQSFGTSAQNAPSFSPAHGGFPLIIEVTVQISPLLGDLPCLTQYFIYILQSTCLLSHPPSVPPLQHKLCESSDLICLVHCTSPGVAPVSAAECSFSPFLWDGWGNRWISLSRRSQRLLRLLWWQGILTSMGSYFIFLTHLSQFLQDIMNLPN